MLTNRTLNHMTAIMLMTMLLVNTVAAGGGLSACHCSSSACHCSSIDTKILEQCCCQKKTLEESSSSCCQEFGSQNDSECCQSEKKSNSCLCGCQHDTPVPNCPPESTQSRVQVESTISSNTLSVISHVSKEGNKSCFHSSEAASATPNSVQVLCCTWLT